VDNILFIQGSKRGVYWGMMMLFINEIQVP